MELILVIMKISDLILSLRKSKNMKQQELAKKAGIPITVLSKLENDAREPQLHHIRKISAALGMPYQLFLLYSLDQEKLPDEKQPELEKILDAINEVFL